MNKLLWHRNANYLEIGVWRGETIEAVNARRRVGVDPFCLINTKSMPRGMSFHKVTSDSYFEDSRDTFDAVFVDGLHSADQALRGISNSLSRLRPGGFVLVDDVIPPNYCSSLPDYEQAVTCAETHQVLWNHAWTGNVFQAVRSIIDARISDLRALTIVGQNILESQTLLWWEAGTRSSSIERVPFLLSESAKALKWSEEFSFGVPLWMNPVPMKTAIQELAFTRQQLASPLTTKR